MNKNMKRQQLSPRDNTGLRVNGRAMPRSQIAPIGGGNRRVIRPAPVQTQISPEKPETPKEENNFGQLDDSEDITVQNEDLSQDNNDPSSENENKSNSPNVVLNQTPYRPPSRPPTQNRDTPPRPPTNPPRPPTQNRDTPPRPPTNPPRPPTNPPRPPTNPPRPPTNKVPSQQPKKYPTVQRPSLAQRLPTVPKNSRTSTLPDTQHLRQDPVNPIPVTPESRTPRQEEEQKIKEISINTDNGMVTFVAPITIAPIVTADPQIQLEEEIDFEAMSEEDRIEYADNLRIEFNKKLDKNKKYRDWHFTEMPDTADPRDLRIYTRKNGLLSKHISIDMEVRKYKVYLLIGAGIIEFLLTKIIGINATNFTTNQWKLIKTYDSLFYELAERNLNVTGEGWSLEARIAYLIGLNILIYVVLNILVSYVFAGFDVNNLSSLQEYVINLLNGNMDIDDGGLGQLGFWVDKGFKIWENMSSGKKTEQTTNNDFNLPFTA